MAFGKHWEWRGFGVLPLEERRAIESLPLKFPASQEVTDEYLYVPGCAINVKLRLGTLKFKRLLEARGSIELWLEDEAENHDFPIEPATLAKLASDLGVRIGRRPDHGVEDRQGLLDLLRDAEPAVGRVVVEKHRWQRCWSDRPGGSEVTVELAEILAPERVTSVGLEHPEAERVDAARDALGLERALRRLSYLEVLGIWASGGTVLTGDV